MIFFVNRIYSYVTPPITRINPYTQSNTEQREEGEGWNNPPARQGHCGHMAVGKWNKFVIKNRSEDSLHEHILIKKYINRQINEK